MGEIANFSTVVDEFEIDFAMQYNDGYSETILSFANNVRTYRWGNA